MIKNIDEIPKTRNSIDNLEDYQQYQNSFVIFDAESNFQHIYAVFSYVVITEINILIHVMRTANKEEYTVLFRATLLSFFNFNKKINKFN